MTDPAPLPIDDLLAHREWLRRLALRLVRDEDAADDAVQQTWVAALRRPPRTDTPVRGWLATVLRNTLRQRHRASTRRAARERESAAPEPGADPAETVERFERQRILVEEVAALAEPGRTTVLLRYFDALPPAEIARRQGVPVRTVETRLRRARETLRARMDARNAGRRAAWAAPLAPWALGGTAEGGLVSGVTAMGASKIVIAAAAALSVWFVLRPTGDGSGPSAPTPPPSSAAAPSPAPPARVERETDATPDDGAGSTDVSAPAPGPAAPEPGETALEIRVGDDLDAPLAGVRVALVRDGVVVAQGNTNERGAVSFDPIDGALDCAVTGGAVWPSVHRLSGAAGTRRVRVPAGVPLGGRVVVDEAPPDEPIRLILDVHAQSVVEPALPPAVWTSLGEPGLGPQTLAVDTDDAGRFRFVGLPAGIRGRLRVFSTGYAAPDGGPPDFPVDGARADLALPLSALPRLRGRIVDADGGPVRAVLGVHSRRARGGGSTRTNVMSGDDGRFEVRIEWADVAAVRLEARTTERDGRGTFSFAAPFERRHDVGDLRLGGSAPLAFRVVDPDDRPIAGATAYGADGGAWSRPSDAGGVLSLPLPDGTRRLIVSADGFEPAAVDVAAVLAPDAVVRLAPATAVVVRLDGPTGLHDAVHVEVRSDAQLFSPLFWELAGLGGGRAGGRRMFTDGTGSGAMHRFRADGTIRITNLAPGVAFDLTVRSALGFVVAHRRLVLAAAESREVLVPLPPARTVAGVVLDPAGRPLARARVGVAHVAAEPTVEFTKSDGRFRFDGVLAPTVTLLAERPGHSPVRLDSIAVPEDGLDVTMRLPPARTVEVTVIDEAGAAVDGLEVTATAATPTTTDLLVPGVDAEETRDGRTTLFDVPTGPVLVAFEHAGVTHERVLPPGVDAFRFVVPTTGGVVARWNVVTDRTRFGEVRLVPTADAGAAITADDVTITEHAPDGSVELPRVLPGRYRVTLELWHDDWEATDVVAEGVVEVVAGAVVGVIWN